MRNKMKYVYFVEYTAIPKPGALQVRATASIARVRKLDTMAEVKFAAECLKEKWGYDDLMITNFILLNKKGIL